MAMLLGCNKSPYDGPSDKGRVELQPTATPQLNIVTAKAANAYDIPTTVADYMIKVTNMADNSVVLKDLPLSENSEISLPKGTFKVDLESSPVANAAFDQPIYKGTAQCAVATGKSTTMEITTRLACVVVDLSYSEKITSKFASYRTTVSGNGADKLVFDETTTGKLGYLSTPLTALNYEIEVVTVQGVRFSSTGTVANLQSGDLLQLAFDIADTPANDKEPLVLDLKLTKQLNQIEETFTFGAVMGTAGLPTITGRLLDVSKPVGVKYQQGAQVKLDLGTPGGLSKILFMFNSEDGELAGLGKLDVVDILKNNNSTGLGVSFDEGGVEGAPSTLMNLTEFTKKLPGSATGSQSFRLTVGLLDQNGQYAAREITFNVYGISITTLSVADHDRIDWFGARGARNMVNATLSGRYNVDTEPEGMVFMYHRAGDSGWEIAEPKVNLSTKQAQATISIPADGAIWEYKLATDNESGDTINFVSATYPTIPNSSLDSWFQESAKIYNPVSPWSSSNNDFGTNVIQVGGWNGSGSSARIESKYIIIAFASGALFTGHMEMNAGDPYKSSLVGIPFEGRPTKLTGYFKYDGQTINRTKDLDNSGNGAANGAPDQCEIAIKLEKWGAGNNYELRWKDGFVLDNSFDHAKGPDYKGAANGRVATALREQISVGYGQLMTTGQSEWKYFEIPVTYYKDQMPDHIIITAVSSAWGGYLSGGEGSTLYVDNLSLAY